MTPNLLELSEQEVLRHGVAWLKLYLPARSAQVLRLHNQPRTPGRRKK